MSHFWLPRVIWSRHKVYFWIAKYTTKNNAERKTSLPLRFFFSRPSTLPNPKRFLVINPLVNVVLTTRLFQTLDMLCKQYHFGIWKWTFPSEQWTFKEMYSKALNCLSVSCTHSLALPSCLNFSVDYIETAKFQIFVFVVIISPNFAYPRIKTGFGKLKIWNILSEVIWVTAAWQTRRPFYASKQQQTRAKACG